MLKTLLYLPLKYNGLYNNGPAYRKNRYDVKMANAFQRHSEASVA